MGEHFKNGNRIVSILLLLTIGSFGFSGGALVFAFRIYTNLRDVQQNSIAQSAEFRLAIERLEKEKADKAELVRVAEKQAADLAEAVKQIQAIKRGPLAGYHIK